MKKIFFGLGVAAFAFFLIVCSPAKVEAQSVKGTYWMFHLTQHNAQAEAMGMRPYVVLQFTDTKVNLGVVYCAISDHDLALTDQLSRGANGGKATGEANMSQTYDFTQSGNTVTMPKLGTGTLSNNGLNLTVVDTAGTEMALSKVNLVAGKWPNIVDQPELMATK